MSSPAALPVAGAPASQPVFPDEILEEIFLRLDAAADLARASAACTTFHRIVSARHFRRRHSRRRFRSLHRVATARHYLRGFRSFPFNYATPTRTITSISTSSPMTRSMSKRLLQQNPSTPTRAITSVQTPSPMTRR